MVRELVDRWYKNEKLIDENELKECITNRSQGLFLYNRLSILIGKYILELENIEVEKSLPSYFDIKGIYTEKNGLKYKIHFFGELQYGTCEECDLYYHLRDYGRRDLVKALKLVMLNIIQKARIEIDFDGFEIEETVCSQIRYKWNDYTNYIIGEKVREYHFDESLIFEYFLLSKNNKECLDIDECFGIFTNLKEDILKEWEIRKVIREYEMTLYLVLLNYLALLEEDTNNQFLKSLLSNSWSEESLNSLEIDDYFNREYPIREMLNEYKEFKRKDLEAV